MANFPSALLSGFCQKSNKHLRFNLMCLLFNLCKRAPMVLANPGKSVILKKTFLGLESLNYLFSSIFTKMYSYIVIVHYVAMLNC